VTFDFEPAGDEDGSYLPGRRGTDPRLDADQRPRAHERLSAKRARRVAGDDESDPE
jgi:GTP-binding protein